MRAGRETVRRVRIRRPTGRRRLRASWRVGRVVMIGATAWFGFYLGSWIGLAGSVGGLALGYVLTKFDRRRQGPVQGNIAKQLQPRAGDGWVDVPIPIHVVERNGRPVVEMVGGDDDGRVLEPGYVYRVGLQLVNKQTGEGGSLIPAEVRVTSDPPYFDITVDGTRIDDYIGIVAPDGSVRRADASD